MPSAQNVGFAALLRFRLPEFTAQHRSASVCLRIPGIAGCRPITGDTPSVRRRFIMRGVKSS